MTKKNKNILFLIYLHFVFPSFPILFFIPLAFLQPLSITERGKRRLLIELLYKKLLSINETMSWPVMDDYKFPALKLIRRQQCDMHTRTCLPYMLENGIFVSRRAKQHRRFGRVFCFCFKTEAMCALINRLAWAKSLLCFMMNCAATVVWPGTATSTDKKNVLRVIKWELTVIHLSSCWLHNTSGSHVDISSTHNCKVHRQNLAPLGFCVTSKTVDCHFRSTLGPEGPHEPFWNSSTHCFTKSLLKIVENSLTWSVFAHKSVSLVRLFT